MAVVWATPPEKRHHSLPKQEASFWLWPESLKIGLHRETPCEQRSVWSLEANTQSVCAGTSINSGPTQSHPTPTLHRCAIISRVEPSCSCMSSCWPSNCSPSGAINCPVWVGSCRQVQALESSRPQMINRRARTWPMRTSLERPGTPSDTYAGIWRAE